MKKITINKILIILIFNTSLFNTFFYIVNNSTKTGLRFGGWLAITIVEIMLLIALGLIIKLLFQNAGKDSLTLLDNRNTFYIKLKTELEKLKKSRLHISLLMIDIDNFKKINDTYGHLKGDEVLKKASEIFLNNVRNTDTIVRWGGEEFIIILPNTNYEGATFIAERIRQCINKYEFKEKDTIFNISVSIGIASTNKVVDMESLLKSVDKALYKAKERKNSIELIAI